MYKYKRFVLVLAFILGLCIGAMTTACESKKVEPVESELVTYTASAHAVKPVVIEVREIVTVVEPAPEPVVEVPQYSEEELEMLALVIYQEAGGDACSDDTRQMVGEVVLNRVASSRYPDTMYEVVTQRAQYGRLYWTGLVWPERASKPAEAHAVERAYNCAEALLTGSVNRLLPTDTIYQAEFEQGTETVAECDGLYFCR